MDKYYTEKTSIPKYNKVSPNILSWTYVVDLKNSRFTRIFQLFSKMHKIPLKKNILHFRFLLILDFVRSDDMFIAP